MVNDIARQALMNLQREGSIASDDSSPDYDIARQALSNLGGTAQPKTQQQPTNIFEAPGFAQTGPLRALTGVGQELAEFAYKVPKLFGADIGRPPQAVKTGLGEKLGAGAIEYALGAGALKAAPVVQKGIEAVGKIPSIGKALTSPITQRAVGMGALGAVEQPEEPLKGAAVSAALSPIIELGLKSPKAVASVFKKLKLNPNVMRNTVKNEFNSLIDTVGNKIGINREQDADRVAMNAIGSKYGKLDKEAGVLYDEAEKTLEGVKYSTDKIENSFEKEMDLFKDSTDPKYKRINSKLLSLKEKIKNPGKFLREINREKSSAYKTGNHELIESLDNISKDFEDSVESQSIENEGLRIGRNKLKTASDFFKKNVVPFRKRAPVKTEQGKRKDIFTEFFKAHSRDKSKGLLKNIGSNIEDLEHMSNIAPEIRDHLAFSELKKGFNDPEGFIKSFRGLTSDQKNKYFSSEYLDRLEKFSKLYEEHPAIFKKPKVSPLTFGERPLVSLKTTGLPALAGGILKGIGKTKIPKKILESEFEGIVSRSKYSPILKALARGGILAGVSNNEER